MNELGNLTDWDVILVGGGLASGLLAYRLKSLKPHLKIRIIEQGSTLGGNHTWSFHSSDLTLDELTWVSPLLSRSWGRYTVEFPSFSRTFQSGYHSIRSEKFHEVVAPLIGDGLLLGRRVKSVTQNSVRLSGDQVISGRCVIDGRGFCETTRQEVGYQKFVGLDLTLSQPHGITDPVLMDVTCLQEDGFRFFYLLPWSERSLLIEDTHYSNFGSLEMSEYVLKIKEYIQERGWQIVSIDREEVGSLPIPLTREFTSRDSWVKGQQIPCIGVKAGLFHPTTGYSFPYAARLADAIARLPDLQTAPLARWMTQYSRQEDTNGKFFRLLNRMLFLGAKPEDRYKILERFYRFSNGVIQRFYSGDLKFSDYVRILSGQPPIPIQRAIRCFSEKRERIQIENG